MSAADVYHVIPPASLPLLAHARADGLPIVGLCGAVRVPLSRREIAELPVCPDCLARLEERGEVPE